MKGRGNPQQGGRGRGYFGRGGRGNAPAQNNNRGTIPTIGAYLDLPPGKDIVPGAVTKWMIKLKEYSLAKNDTEICTIFGQDGTLGRYPVFVEPERPGGEATVAERDIHKIDYTEYKKKLVKFTEDKRKLYGTMLGQMSDSSKTRAREDPVGEEADAEMDPRKLLQAIIATHIGDSTLGVPHQLFNISQKYHNLVMGPYDSLSTYLTNTRSALSAIEQAYTRAGRAQIDAVYPEDQMALKFIMGLNNHYAEFKYFYINNLKEWPPNLDAAHAETIRFSPNRDKRELNTGAFERANAFAMTGRGGRGGRGYKQYPGGHNGKSTHNGKWVRDGPGPNSPEGQKSEKGSPIAVYTASKIAPPGYKRGPCNNCSKFGHFAQDCREEPQPMEAQYWKEAGPRSPGGKGTPPPSPGTGK